MKGINNETPFFFIDINQFLSFNRYAMNPESINQKGI